MSDRRRQTRFVATEEWIGDLFTSEPVTIEEVDGESVWITAQTKPRIGETCVLRVSEAPEAGTLTVRVADSRPVFVGTAIQHRLRLEISCGDIGNLGNELPGEPVE